MTRMLTGERCAESNYSRGTKPFDGGMARVTEAKRAVADLAFVGLTERWNETVCLFHRMFGGSINPAEFMNFHHNHKHDSHQPYREDSLQGFRDDADEEVYAAAKERFESLLQEHVPAGQSACDGLSQLPQSHCRCNVQSRQCGPAPDVSVDCGQCPTSRLSFIGGVPPDSLGLHSTMPVSCNNGYCEARDPMLPRALFDWTPNFSSLHH